MNTTTPHITWTPRDEQTLKELTERKAAFEEATLKPLIELVGQQMPFISLHRADEIAAWMRDNADTIRDLLLPFDSGVRCAKKEG